MSNKTSTKALIDTIRAEKQPLTHKFLRKVADRLEELEAENEALHKQSSKGE